MAEKRNQRRPGRPRDPEVILRDGMVLRALEKYGDKTRNELADLLDVKKSLVWESLNRLHRADPPRVRKCIPAEGRFVTWSARVREPCR